MGRAPDDLFDFMKRTSSTKVALDRLLIWIRRKKERFPSFVVLSFVLHVTIFGFLAVSWAVSEKPRGATAGLDNAAAARQALGALRLDAKESALLSGALACLTEDQLEEVLERAPELDPRPGGTRLGPWRIPGGAGKDLPGFPDQRPLSRRVKEELHRRSRPPQEIPYLGKTLGQAPGRRR